MNIATKITSLLLAFGMLANMTAITAFASDGDALTTATNALTDVTVAAKSAVLMDANTGKLLFQKNPHDKMSLASVTKIMTLLLAMEKLDKGEIMLQDMVTVSTDASKMGGSQIWLKEGEQMSVDNLLKATAVASANDAASALAEHIGGDRFVTMMNERAAQLGMKNTCFLNPNGLDEVGHFSTAYDIALMTAKLLEYPMITNYTKIWMDSLRDGKTQLVNTNKLIRFYKGATGMKTGTTNDAGSCISATAVRGDLSLIAVVMGCATSDDRFNDARRLLDYGFASFTVYKPVTKQADIGMVTVLNGVVPQVDTHVDIDEKIVVSMGEKVTETITLNESVTAPVTIGQKLGEVVLSIDSKPIYTYDITAANEVLLMTFGGAIKQLLTQFVQL